MKLPDKFQFRVDTNPGYTHSIKRNANGDYEVKWARGWYKVTTIDWVVIDEGAVRNWVKSGGWIMAEETPKQEEVKLPDEFYFEHAHQDCSGKVFKISEGWHVQWKGDDLKHFYSSHWVPQFVKDGMWKIVDKKPLSPEDQRRKKDFEEQVQQLNSAIKLNEQTIEHHTRLIANYKSRQDDLRDKIAEIMGEELPSVTKAKALKAELGKLKGNV